MGLSLRRALFPGTFDPITCGHIEIVERGLEIFDEIVIGVGVNTSKNTMFAAEIRTQWITALFAEEPRVHVLQFSGLTINFAAEVNARFLLRGLRSCPDFEYEKNIELLNRQLSAGKLETVFLISNPATSHISSTLVREVLRFQGSLDGLVPPLIAKSIAALQKNA
jgi:pantetheine-phosphate adenylyltransferase